jgi:hypothetical protein
VVWPILLQVVDEGTDDLEKWLATLPDDEAELVAHLRQQPGTPPIGQAVTDEEMAEMRRQMAKSLGYGGPDHLMSHTSEEHNRMTPGETE